ncbi:MAG: outer membrane lipoprotein carrier protein LolA [Desulfuromonas sp.]|nr:MAG: outer membrane lipoprotein carrier protein LolA [Desulfuromonas sp.]
MKKIACFATLLAVMALAQTLWAAPIGLSDVINTLEKPFKSDATRMRGGSNSALLDFEGDFFQEAEIATLGQAQHGAGRVMVKYVRSRADRVPVAQFRWEYDQPTRQEFVSDGKTLWVYLPENNQVIQSDIEFTGRTRSDDPMTFLTGMGNLSRDFQITWGYPNQDVAGNYVLELSPRRSSVLIQRMLLVVDRDAVLAFKASGTVGDTFPIRASTVFSPEGNRTQIEFSNIRVNRGLPDSLFRFILPAGVDVIRPTGKEMGF